MSNNYMFRLRQTRSSKEKERFNFLPECEGTVRERLFNRGMGLNAAPAIAFSAAASLIFSTLRESYNENSFRLAPYLEGAEVYHQADVAIALLSYVSGVMAIILAAVLFAMAVQNCVPIKATERDIDHILNVIKKIKSVQLKNSNQYPPTENRKDPVIESELQHIEQVVQSRALYASEINPLKLRIETMLAALVEIKPTSDMQSNGEVNA